MDLTPNVGSSCILGCTGFVGSHLFDLLSQSEREYDLCGIKRISSRTSNIDHIINDEKLCRKKNIDIYDADLNDSESLYRALKKNYPTRIYHLAAQSLVSPSWNHAELYMETNACGTIRLFNVIRRLQIEAKNGCELGTFNYMPRIVSTCTPEEVGDTTEIIDEETKIAPVNMYAASKVAQNMVCQVYQKSYGLDIVRTRFFNAIGPRRTTNAFSGSVANQIALIEAKKQDPIIWVGNLEAVRNFTDVRDISRGLVEVMKKGKTGELYLFGSKDLYSMKELLEKMISLSTRKDITYMIDPELVRPTELKRFEGCFDKMASISDWKQEISLEDSLKSEINYWRKRV